MTDNNNPVTSALAKARAGVTSLFASGRSAVTERVDRAADGLASFRDERSPILDTVVSQPTAKQSLLLSGTTLTLLGVLLTGFIADVALISPLRYAREQIVQSEQIRFTLANSEAPVGQMDKNGNLYPLGTPVAIMQIPALNLTAVVGEGTTSRVLLSAPGHRRDTPLPGQAGASVIYGRQSLYGGPFGALNQLRPVSDDFVGNTIRVTTAQGVSLYRVTDVRVGDAATAVVPSPSPTPSTTPTPTPTPTAKPKKKDAEVAETVVTPTATSPEGRLTLVSTAGLPFFPDRIIRVDADLVTPAFATPLPVIYPASLTPAERLLGVDDSGWLPLLLLLELGLAAVALALVGMKRWGRLHTWVVAVPVLLAIGIALAEQVVILLPNLY